ncbi:ABC transporter permease [Microbacterium kribbense]|uniref:ABC transporter permease n=1 Tax=Microbacterium kribbense TaxID=433645 RepID=A0ABP7GGM9_9MICO
MSPAESVRATANPGAAPAARPGVGWALLASELSVLFRRWRTWAMLAALAAVPLLIAIAVRATTHEPPAGRGPQFLSQITHNGFFVGLTGLLVCIPLFLPLTVGVVAGDTIAGEAGHGTLRYLLIAPAGRIRLLVVKYLGAAVFCAAGTLAVIVAGLAIGAALFPIGPVTLLSGSTVGFGEAIVRLLLIGVFVLISLLGLCAIGLFISTLTNVPVGAMAATVVLAVMSQVLDSVPQLDWLGPWLFSHYWLSFADLLREPISWTSLGDNALLQLGYVAVCGALAYGRFSTKDILS